MRHCRLILILVLTLGFANGNGLSARVQQSKPTLYYIPHTHWEGAVFQTREEYLRNGLGHILHALQIMKANPKYKFTLDQVAYFKPFLERFPEEAAAFRKFVKEGRLGIVGGMDVMPDDVKPGGELFVRQMMYGKKYCREALGVDVTVAWLLDTFGHHPQMPQLLRLAGYKSFWFCRGVPNNKMPSEFNWKGIDGTAIPAFWIPGFYGLFYGPPGDQAGFDKFFKDRYNYLNPFARGNERVGLAGVDVCEPEPHVPPLVDGFNSNPAAPFNIRFAIPTEFAEIVAKRKDTPTIEGDFNPIFQGTYSSRSDLKQTTRELEQKLLTAEKLAALSNWLGHPTDEEMTWRAWEPVLFNQTHDLASGVMTDHVYADTVQSYAYASRLADEMIDQHWENVVRHIDTRGEGTPIVVFNTLGWTRTDVAEFEIGIANKGFRSLLITDSAGNRVAAQSEPIEKYSDESMRKGRVTFIARDIPAMGYAVYHAVPSTDPAAGSQPRGLTDSIENEYLSATYDVSTGALKSLFDKKANRESLSGPANVVARLEDKGDLWEPFHTLDGGQYIQMTVKQPVPTAKNALLSTADHSKLGDTRLGSVYSEFTVAHPYGSGTFSTRIRLYNGIPRLDIRTELVNNEKFVRYQALFPTSIANGKNVQEIPFGAVERPNGVEYPAQQWVDYSDGKNGVALLNFGMPGNLVSGDTLMLSMMRAQTLGDYNEGHPSDSGFGIGIPRTFNYAVVPHTGDWRDAGVYRKGLAFNHPLIVRKVEAHPGNLPSRWSALKVEPDNVLVTTMKPGKKGTMVLRVYEATGKPTDATIRLTVPATSAEEVNLLEYSIRKLPITQNSVGIRLHPFEIKTIRFRVGSAQLR